MHDNVRSTLYHLRRKQPSLPKKTMFFDFLEQSRTILITIFRIVDLYLSLGQFQLDAEPQGVRWGWVKLSTECLLATCLVRSDDASEFVQKIWRIHFKLRHNFSFLSGSHVGVNAGLDLWCCICTSSSNTVDLVTYSPPSPTCQATYYRSTPREDQYHHDLFQCHQTKLFLLRMFWANVF